VHARAGARVAACVRLDLSDGRRLTIRGQALIGRAPVAAPGEEIAQLVTVNDPARSVSTTHVALAVDDTGAWIVDRGSTNGTVVTLPDGQQILCVPWQRVRVAVGARVRFGDASFLVATDTDGIGTG
jgi:pSer/pThr/pTyr-binding forkhead associated (FHA) protein